MKAPFIILILLLPFQGFAQAGDLEIGGFFGVANYQGDLAEDQIEVGETRVGVGTILKYHINNNFSVRGNAYFGKISGDDRNSARLATRALSFEANVTELGVGVEYRLLGRNRVNRAGIFIPQFTPFIFTGGGVSLINATVDFSETPPDQIKVPFPEPNDRTTFIFAPIGAGLRMDLAEPLTVCLEVGWRFPFSDYIDGVSINGRPTRSDWYWFAGATISYYIVTKQGFNF